MKQFYNFSLIRLSYKLTFFVSIFFVFVLSSCTTTEETVEPVAELPVKKKVLFNQRTDGGKNSVTVIEETQGNKRILRIVLQRGGLQSNLIHPIDSPNFVIAVPLQDATSKRLSLKTAAFEQSLKLDLDQLLSRYLSPERFNVSVIINWDQKLLQEVQLKNLPLEADVTKADTSDDDTDLSESTKRNHELKEALKSVQVSVLLDNTLPETQEQFLKRLIPAQEFYLADRGDTVTVERTSFPKPFSDSIAPYEEQIVRRKLTELLLKYVAKTDFVVNVKFSLIESNEETTNAPPSASNIKMEINLLLDETVLPTVDIFLKEAIPLAINFDQKRGDTLAIIRKDFPERSDSSLSPEQRGALKDYRAKILEAFQTGDYVAGLEWAAKGLKVAVKRSDKIFILKMKGSLHFLLEEKEEALEMWQHVQRLDPKDEEVRQMLDNME